MVLEVAQFDIQRGSETAFEEGYRSAVSVVRESPGLLSLRMTRGVETPTRFVLLAEWESLEAHQAFRDSDRFVVWRSAIGPHLVQLPHVEHVTDVD